eukprot:scaffold2385_cov126-Isochrysis_galbana.AAC.8
MAGWVCRHRVDDNPDAMGETIDSPFAGFTLGTQLLPMEFARLRVEGGAPYLLNPNDRSHPQYQPDAIDSPQTYSCSMVCPMSPKSVITGAGAFKPRPRHWGRCQSIWDALGY